MPAHLASRAAVSDQGPPRLVGGRVSAPDPGLARGLSPGEVGRVRPSPDPLPALQGSPAVVRGGRIRRRWSSDTRGPPNWPWPPEPGVRVHPGRRRRSRPTLTTPRESVPRRTGRGRHRTSFRNCQGLFSRPRMIPSANSCRSSRSVPLLLASSLAEARRRRRHRSEFSQRKLSAAPYLPVAICCFHRLIRW